MSNESCDVLVVGAGVFGLWAARRALEVGARVRVVEIARVGAGASGGVLGALTAHHPSGWNAKKEFQFQALAALPGLVADLEAETGLRVGYRRCGRLMPVRNLEFRAQVEARAASARTVWRVDGAPLAYELQPAADPAWLSASAQTHGVIWDALAARIAPRSYLAALAASVSQRGAILEEGVGYLGWDGAARLSDGRRVAAGAVVLAAGWRAFDLAALALARDDPTEIGSGVKGQAVRLAAPEAVDRPLIYEDGVYVIPHDDGSVAVGSTDRRDWRDPQSVDPTDDAFLSRARALCPALRGAPVLEWWAGVRPRARRRDPMIGRLSETDPIWAMMGGYKISFGVAHRLATVLIDDVFGRPAEVRLPPSFTVAHHLEVRAATR